MFKPRVLYFLAFFTLCNNGIGQTTLDCVPIGWHPVLTNARNVVTGLDTITKHSGKASGFIKRPSSESLGTGALKQSISAIPYRGHQVRLSLYIKTADLESAYVWFRAETLETGLYHSYLGGQLEHSVDWTEYSLVLPVPQEAVRLEFGIMIINEGIVWLDDVHLEIDDKSIPAANRVYEESNKNNFPARYYKPNPEPVNLDFEDYD